VVRTVAGALGGRAGASGLGAGSRAGAAGADAGAGGVTGVKVESTSHTEHRSSNEKSVREVHGCDVRRRMF
jgi:outer membrane lipoprotein SlyB